MDVSASEPSQPPKKRNIDCNNLDTHGEPYFQLDKLIDHLTDSAEGKEKCSIHMWDGIDTQKDVMHFPTCNITCVCCVTIYDIMVLIL